MANLLAYDPHIKIQNELNHIVGKGVPHEQAGVLGNCQRQHLLLLR